MFFFCNFSVTLAFFTVVPRARRPLECSSDVTEFEQKRLLFCQNVDGGGGGGGVTIPSTVRTARIVYSGIGTKTRLLCVSGTPERRNIPTREFRCPAIITVRCSEQRRRVRFLRDGVTSQYFTSTSLFTPRFSCYRI